MIIFYISFKFHYNIRWLRPLHHLIPSGVTLFVNYILVTYKLLIWFIVFDVLSQFVCELSWCLSSGTALCTFAFHFLLEHVVALWSLLGLHRGLRGFWFDYCSAGDGSRPFLWWQLDLFSFLAWWAAASTLAAAMTWAHWDYWIILLILVAEGTMISTPCDNWLLLLFNFQSLSYTIRFILQTQLTSCGIQLRLWALPPIFLSSCISSATAGLNKWLILSTRTTLRRCQR